MNMNRDRARKAVEKLEQIGVRKPATKRNKEGELLPLVLRREKWLGSNLDKTLPDGPEYRAKVLHVLADYDEPLEQRVWIGKNLVTGVGGFDRPLVALKNAGDVAARMLLLLYERNDMEGYGGIPPTNNVWKHYEPIDGDNDIQGSARLIRARDKGMVGSAALFEPAWGKKINGWDEHTKEGGPCWQAVEALESSGLIYEMVMVLNRNSIKGKFSSGEEYGNIPPDAEPLYELDCRSLHGYKPVGEQGIGGITARTAGELNRPVASGGQFDGTYAAIVQKGHPAMIAGIYRLRFRVANSKNAGVKTAWARIQQGNREALAFVEQVRRKNNLQPFERKQIDESAQ